jgi:hypothetical protein
MVFPGQTNHYGTLFGGVALAMLAKAAFVASSRAEVLEPGRLTETRLVEIVFPERTDSKHLPCASPRRRQTAPR